MAKEIPLTKGAVAIVDDDDYERLVAMGKWHLSNMGYAVRRTIVDGSKRTIRMHRIVNDTPDGLGTDHINRVRTDNRKANLRTCTQLENMANSGSVINAKGYYYDNGRKRWTVDIKTYNAKSIYLDTEQAAQEYISALKLGRTPTRVFHPKPRHGAYSSSAKLSIANIEDIRLKRREGWKLTDLSALYGVHYSTISKIYLNKTWKKENTYGR